MSIIELFRPKKWKHRDPKIRLEAVLSMEPDATEVLTQVATHDEDPKVCEAALRRLQSADALLEITSQLEGDLSGLARARAGELLAAEALGEADSSRALAKVALIEDQPALAEVARRATDNALRDGALSALDDKGRADVARKAKNVDTRTAAVELISDGTVLRGLALEGGKREVSIAALGRIEDPEHLARIAQHAKNRAVRTRANRKLDEYKRANEPPPEVVSRPVLQSEAVSEPKSEPAQELAESQSEGKESLAAQAAAEATAAEAELRAAEEAERRQLVDRAKEARAPLLEKIEALAKEDAEAAGEAVEAVVAEFEALDAVEPPDAEIDGIEASFAKARKAARRTVMQRELRPEAESVLSELEACLQEQGKDLRNKVEKLRRQLGGLLNKADLDKDLAERREAFEAELAARRAAAREEDEKERQRAADRVHALLEQLETKTGELADLRAAERLQREVRTTAKNASRTIGKSAWKELSKRWEAGEHNLGERLADLREADDWNRHFNQRKQLELCERVEALLEVEDRAAAAADLQAAQRQWREVSQGARDHSEETWERFKKASDAVYARCEGIFEAQKRERAEGLDRLCTICEEAEGLAESTEWKTTAERLKELQADWKAQKNVRRNDSQPLWGRFRGACDVFFGRRNEHFAQLDEERGENLVKKVALCEKVETLQSSSEWKETASKLKDLQSEWKELGPVPRKDSEAIWQRFRSASDHFFARRTDHEDGGRRQSLEQTKELLESLDALLAEPESGETVEPSEIATKVLEFAKAWREIGAIPFDEVESTDARFNELLLKALELHGEGFAGSDLDLDAATRRRTKLAEQAEALALRVSGGDEAEEGGEEKPDEPDLAEQLKAAMARNTFSKEARELDTAQAFDDASRIERSFGQASPVPGEAGVALTERFEKAMARVQKAREASGKRR